jgi:hypothetical protein
MHINTHINSIAMYKHVKAFMRAGGTRTRDLLVSNLFRWPLRRAAEASVVNVNFEKTGPILWM